MDAADLGLSIVDRGGFFFFVVAVVGWRIGECGAPLRGKDELAAAAGAN